MKTNAKLQSVRIAPRKVRLVADLIRGKTALDARVILGFTAKSSAAPLLKLLRSAIANAKHNHDIAEENLYVSKIMVGEGIKLKRYEPRARGYGS